jgi:ribonuclease BN (tRNA processing enzyme)
VRIRILPSTTGGGRLEYLTTFLVNDAVAIDAGSLGFWSSPARQARVGHVFLSHTHADHVCSLPMFVTNTAAQRHAPAVIHGRAGVLESLARDVFNGRVWPDFLDPSARGTPLLALEEAVAGSACAVSGLRVTPVAVDHSVPTVSHVIDDGRAAVVISTDSGPTDGLWKVAAGLPHLKAVFLGTSFPDEERELAAVAGHLTPRLVAVELSKMPPGVPVYAVHIKPGYRRLVMRQLAGLKRPNLFIGDSGRNYAF